MVYLPTRWFKPWPFFIPQLEVPYPLKGSLIHPQKVTKNCQVHETPPKLVNKDSFCGEVLHTDSHDSGKKDIQPNPGKLKVCRSIVKHKPWDETCLLSTLAVENEGFSGFNTWRIIQLGYVVNNHGQQIPWSSAVPLPQVLSRVVPFSWLINGVTNHLQVPWWSSK